MKKKTFNIVKSIHLSLYSESITKCSDQIASVKVKLLLGNIVNKLYFINNYYKCIKKCNIKSLLSYL